MYKLKNVAQPQLITFMRVFSIRPNRNAELMAIVAHARTKLN